ncbi:helix-turn-helix transcriptional regulator [Lacrimispora saccharolytica]|nr:helix-turn-helix transcriptional regulator [Lacrimispora saccharolytica]
MKYGYIKVKVEEMRIKKGISKNKLCHAAELERKQLNAYCRGEIVRIDLNVLARLCAALECSINDLLEYVSK